MLTARILNIIAASLTAGGSAWCWHLSHEHGDWKIVAMAAMFGMGGFMMGALDG